MFVKDLIGIKSLYFKSEACIGMNRVESECFKINSKVVQGHIVFPWLFNIVFMKDNKRISDGGDRGLCENRTWRIP